MQVTTILGGALIQETKPVALAIRAITNGKKNYAQIEKETLVILYGVERFPQFTFERSVIMQSYYKSLEVIHQKPLSAAPRHLQKLLMRLQHYDITIQYKKGKEIYEASLPQRLMNWRTKICLQKIKK